MTEKQKQIAINDVLKIVEEYQAETVNYGSEYRRETAKINAFDRIVESLETIKKLTD